MEDSKANKKKLNIVLHKSKKPTQRESESRQDPRFSKSFIITYFDKNNPEDRYLITHLKNISKGGMCFLTTQRLEEGTPIHVELITPFMDKPANFEGTILGTIGNIANVLYETRMQFKSISKEAEKMLAQLIKFYAKLEEMEDAASNS